MGVFDLLRLVMEEKESENKEAAFGALASYLRSNNYKGKKLFVTEHGGIQFIFAIFKNKQSSVRLLKKAAFLLNDILATEDSILPET